VRRSETNCDASRQVAAGDEFVRSWAFSRDGGILYGVADGHVVACDVASLALRRFAPIPVGIEPGSTYSPGTRVTLSPDGTHLTFATRFSQTSEIWMLDNFHTPGGLWTGWKAASAARSDLGAPVNRR
jgi:hypothetical protein